MNEAGPDSGWRKSSYSGDGDCLEWAVEESGVRLRSSRDPDGPQLSLTRSEWTAFLAGVRAGEADS
jgi:hypothetical protein